MTLNLNLAYHVLVMWQRGERAESGRVTWNYVRKILPALEDVEDNFHSHIAEARVPLIAGPASFRFRFGSIREF